MRKFLTTIFLGLLGVLLVVFFVANRQVVKISIDPINIEQPAMFVELPMWSALAVTLFIGYGLGLVGMWMSNSNLRQRAKLRKAEIKRLKTELDLAATGDAVSDSKAVALRG